MKIFEINQRTSDLVEQLLNLWEETVKSTHKFLSDDKIQQIKKYVPEALNNIPHLIIAKDDLDIPVAFMGIAENKLEMLFVADSERGKGIGKALIEYGIANYSINELTVNEQNPLAKNFYEHMGFRVYKRTDFDEQGNPYPILYMKIDVSEQQ